MNSDPYFGGGVLSPEERLHKMFTGSANVPPILEPITEESVSALQSGTVRFCLQGNMANYLKRTERAGFVGSFKSPFLETVGALFQRETGLSFKKNNFGRYWISIRLEHDFARIED